MRFEFTAFFLPFLLLHCVEFGTVTRLEGLDIRRHGMGRAWSKHTKWTRLQSDNSSTFPQSVQPRKMGKKVLILGAGMVAGPGVK